MRRGIVRYPGYALNGKTVDVSRKFRFWRGGHDLGMFFTIHHPDCPTPIGLPCAFVDLLEKDHEPRHPDSR